VNLSSLYHAREGLPQVLGALCDAFAEYPVMRHILGTGGDYGERLRALVGFFLAGRVLRDEPILTVTDGAELSGVATCTLPGSTPAPPGLEEIRAETWALLGGDALERYDQCVRAWEPLAVAEPNVHVNMLAVPPRFQGRGLGRVLLERVHAMSRERADSRGVSLTTESPANVAFYRHLGYEVVGRRTIAPGLETWGFFRPDERPRTRDKLHGD
jgi:GNAT superfamily N-acetyltransferase